MFDLNDVSAFEIIVDPNDPSITISDNISGFTPSMMFNALQGDVTSIRKYRDRLSQLHLQDTPNSSNNFNNFMDVYDVFN